MSLDKIEMSEAIQAKMSELPGTSLSAVNAQRKFAEAISEYLTDNMEITFSWTAQTTTSPVIVDPVVSFDAKVSWSSFLLVPSVSLVEWGTQLYSQVLGASVIPVKNKTDSPGDYFAITDVGLGPIPWNPLLQTNINTYPESIEAMCEQIISRIKTMVQVNPFLPASHIVSGITYVASVCSMIEIS